MKRRRPFLDWLRWPLFFWGALASLVMSYFALRWAVQPAHALRQELATGFALGLLYGTPAWMALPWLAQRARLGPARRFTPALLLAPLGLALVATLLMLILGGL